MFQASGQPRGQEPLQENETALPPRGEIQEEGRSQPPLPPQGGKFRKKEEVNPPCPPRGEIQEEGRRKKEEGPTTAFILSEVEGIRNREEGKLNRHPKKPVLNRQDACSTMIIGHI